MSDRFSPEAAETDRSIMSGITRAVKGVASDTGAFLKRLLVHRDKFEPPRGYPEASEAHSDAIRETAVLNGIDPVHLQTDAPRVRSAMNRRSTKPSKSGSTS